MNSNSKTAYLWTEKLSERKTGYLCPEKPERCTILNFKELFPEANKIELLTWESREENILELVHQAKYIKEVKEAYSSNRRAFDSGDTRVTENSFSQALLSASAALEAVDIVIKKKFKNAFCAIRPPGHHANAKRALGFCIFNNIALAAKYAQVKYGVSKVLIIDWDVHPGNGAQEIFWEDSSVFTLSFHGEGLLGKSGDKLHRGDGAGLNFSKNVPFEKGTPASKYIATFKSVLNEVYASFKPELTLVAAGFDAHKADPTMHQSLEEKDFAELTRIVLENCQKFGSIGPVCTLEGGYNFYALRDSVQAHCLALSEA